MPGVIATMWWMPLIKINPTTGFSVNKSPGDLLPSRSPEHRIEMLVATGFLALGSMDLNERDGEQFMLDRIDDQIDTLGRSVLALTTALCALPRSQVRSPITKRLLCIGWNFREHRNPLVGRKNRGGGKGNYTNTSLLASLGSSVKSNQAAKPNASQKSSPAIVALRKRIRALESSLKKAGAAAEAKKAHLFTNQKGQDKTGPAPERRRNEKEKGRQRED